MNALSFGQNQRPAQIRVLGARGRREWVASIFAAVVILKKPFTPLEVPFVFSGLIWMPR